MRGRWTRRGATATQRSWSKAALLERLTVGRLVGRCQVAGGRRQKRRGGTHRQDEAWIGWRRLAHGGSGSGRPGGGWSRVLAAGGVVLANPRGCDGARARAAAGVGALRRVRSGAGVLMRGIEEGLVVASVGRGMAPRDDGAWRNGRAAAR